jgi:hypothetical protein
MLPIHDRMPVFLLSVKKNWFQTNPLAPRPNRALDRVLHRLVRLTIPWLRILNGEHRENLLLPLHLGELCSCFIRTTTNPWHANHFDF